MGHTLQALNLSHPQHIKHHLLLATLCLAPVSRNMDSKCAVKCIIAVVVNSLLHFMIVQECVY